jgi:glycosyltransferase involved in cell wall biosynthesis
MKKILILHRYCQEEALSTNASLTSLFKSLIDLDYQVFFTSFSGKNNIGIKGVIYEPINLKLNRGSAYDKVIKSLAWVLLAPYKVFRLSRNYDFDIIYCDDSLPFYPALCKVVSLGKSKVIMRLGDLQTGYLFASRQFIPNLFFHLFHSIEKISWKIVDGIIPISNPMKAFIRSSGAKNTLDVVKESVNLLSFQTQSEINPLVKWGVLPTETVAMFHGAIERAKGIEVLLFAAKALALKYKDLRFVIIGDGTDYKRIQNLVRELEIKNVILTGWIQFSDVSAFIKNCSFGIALRSDNMANNFVVTTALMQYYTCQKPVIAPSLEAIKEVCIDGISGFTFIPGSPESLIFAIDSMMDQRNNWGKFGRSGRDLVSENFDSHRVGVELSLVIHKYNQSFLI